MQKLLHIFFALMTAGLSACASAECSRPIVVPFAATGLSVIVDGNEMRGIYPELLNTISKNSGCHFVVSVVPRARQEQMFQDGQADILLPASRSTRRDKSGHFISFIHARPALILLADNKANIHNFAEILAHHELRVAVVRGFDYGLPYHALLKQLSEQGRLTQEAEPLSIARLMKSRVIDATIMAPSIFSGAVQTDGRVQDLQSKLRYEPLDELPWIESGAYISQTSLSPKDFQIVLGLLQQAQKNGLIWAGYQHYYSPEILKVGLRPR